jgi:hypothetical protein
MPTPLPDVGHRWQINRVVTPDKFEKAKKAFIEALEKWIEKHGSHNQK